MKVNLKNEQLNTRSFTYERIKSDYRRKRIKGNWYMHLNARVIKNNSGE